jgi:MoxR-like ATPase
MTTAVAPANYRRAKVLATEDDMKEFKTVLHRLGYYTNSSNLLMQLWLVINDMELEHEHLAAINLDGPPGSGKTYAAKILAKLLEAQLLELQFTQGIGRETMMHDINIAAVVAAQVDAAIAASKGDTSFSVSPEDLIIPGVLQVALETSIRHKVVLLLDEIDKAKPSIDSMLLTFLQDGAIAHPTQRGTVIRGNPKNLLVVMTKNNERGITEPLMRRVKSVNLGWPAPETELHIVKKMAAAQLSGMLYKGDLEVLAAFLITCANKIRKFEKTLRKVPSSPELAQALVDCIRTPPEHRGEVICRVLFKYEDDFVSYNESRKGTDEVLTEDSVKRLVPRF